MNCIFCQIIKGEKPARIFYEDSDIIVFADIFPKAPIHLLFCPKYHYPMIQDMENEILLKLVDRIKVIAKELGVENNYRLILNNGPLSGQIVGHLHFHFLSNADRELKFRSQSSQ